MKGYSYFCLTAIVYLILFIESCKKLDEVRPPNVSCKAIKQYTNNNQIPPDTARYSYVGNRISQINFNDFYRNIEYNNLGKIAKVYYFHKGQLDTLMIMSVFYDTDGKIKRLERIAKYLPLYKMVLEFENANGKVNQVKVSEYDVNGVYIPNEEVHTFTYTAKNITSHKIEVSGGNTELISLDYDKKANYFTKQDPNFFILDPFFSDSWTYNRKLLPFVLSDNNVIRTSDTTVYGGTIQYNIDKNENIKEFSIGSRLIGYEYSCGL